MQQALVTFNEGATHELIHSLQESCIGCTEFEKARRVARIALGAEPLDTENREIRIGFWFPGREAVLKQGATLELELFIAPDSFRFQELRPDQVQTVEFTRCRVPMVGFGEYLVGVYSGVPVGSRDKAGALYCLRYVSPEGNELRVRDPLAASTPLGAFAPSEIYDMATLLAARSDKEYFTQWARERYPDGSYRARSIGSTLEIHVGTATAEGTVAALTRHYQDLAERMRANQSAGLDPYAGMSAAEKALLAYDSIELMPEVPQAERSMRGFGEFFVVEDESPAAGAAGTGAAGLAATGAAASSDIDILQVKLKKPDLKGWGYDVVLYGTAALNPGILETGRPDEFLELIETLHTMPGRPIQVALDSVLGHADFQGAELLRTFDQDSPELLKYQHSRYLAGPNMYGRDVRYGDPTVRAILLEMYHRKNNYGIDAVRVDGGQDFVKDIDELTGLKIQDDDFLNAMSTEVQHVAGITRRLDINIEDGRPWPDDLNWIYNSSYLCHVWERNLPFGDRTKQWSPLIFAHNVHAKFKWFFTKWDRFKDVFKEGADWITGNSTHDNARYLYRMTATTPSSKYTPGAPLEEYYNNDLGNELPEVAYRALNNPALTALNLGFFPGSPMFFYNSTVGTPWLFFRDLGDFYDTKIVADEAAPFLVWYVPESMYAAPQHFRRCKELGFDTRGALVARPGSEDKSGSGARPGFLNELNRLTSLIKTDAKIFLYLYDSPSRVGGYADRTELETRIERLLSPQTGEDEHRRAVLDRRIAADRFESDRKLGYCLSMIPTAREHLAADRRELPAKHQPELVHQDAKLTLLAELAEQGHETSLRLLIEDAAMVDDYDIDSWATNANLLSATPPHMRPLDAEKLRSFARAFQLDAAEICNVAHHAGAMSQDFAEFALKLRLFRQANPWLADNPSNDIHFDFFNRNVVTNGARHLGGWSDKGDIIHANTLYYGWRSSPDKARQILIIANMEGRPLRRYSLRFLLPVDAVWHRMLVSPGMADSAPDIIDRTTVLKDFRGGEVLLYERYL
ncbi:MAG: hypothetical protein EA428_12210 [Spirochaetaceae bacterium]|nr:MAG: hypothetical protein EA428_12210 [Spirochaetaceae bacterium]